MADLPAQNSASGPAPAASGPAATPADNQPAQTGPSGPAATGPAASGAEAATGASAPVVQLTEDQKTYLKGQGLTDAELNSPDALAKIISHAQSSQKTLAETKSQLDKIVNPGATGSQPQNPLVPGASQPQDGNSGSQPQGGLDAVTAFNLSANLATQFPGVKEDFMSGKFYQDMQAAGLPLSLNGQVNLAGITSFATLRQKEISIEAKEAELNKPGEIPAVNPSTPQQPAADAPMTDQMAKAILLQDPNHARAAEAKQFLQKKV